MPVVRAPIRRRSQHGFGLVEMLISLAVLSLALLAHVSTTVRAHRQTRAQRTRADALLVLDQFVERLRADEDWGSLCGRLRARQALSLLPFGKQPRLADGRRAWRPSTYYADLVPVHDLDGLAVLVDVPHAPAATGLPLPVLREDVTDPAFGLPDDLNGDGVLDSEPRDFDYVVLPVTVIVRWVPTGEPAQELRVTTWLRGNR